MGSEKHKMVHSKERDTILEETLSSHETVNELDHGSRLGEGRSNDNVMLKGGCCEFMKKPELGVHVRGRYKIGPVAESFLAEVTAAPFGHTSTSRSNATYG